MYTAGLISVKHPEIVSSQSQVARPQKVNSVVEALKSEAKEVMRLNQPPEKSFLQGLEETIVQAARVK